jgi:hypothetical protein
MSLARRRIYLAAFVLHFLLIFAISAHDTLWLIGHGLTILPKVCQAGAEKAERFTSTLLAQDVASTNPLRRGLSTYLHLAGIERGYGYFAPNVPVSYKLVLELHHADGRVDYEVPGGRTSAAELRLASLLDEIGRTRNDQLREYLIKMLAWSVWREHPDVLTVRAVFGLRNLPSVEEFERGTEESYEFLYAYEFSRANISLPVTNP